MRQTLNCLYVHRGVDHSEEKSLNNFKIYMISSGFNDFIKNSISSDFRSLSHRFMERCLSDFTSDQPLDLRKLISVPGNESQPRTESKQKIKNCFSNEKLV